MKHPLRVSTLEEAASWLSEYSGRQWSAREVLDLGFKRALADFQQDGIEATPILWAALPPSTRFVFRRWTVERGCERRPAEWQMVPITYESAFALLSSGGSAAVEFSRASDPWSGEDGLCIDSPDTHVLVSTDMLRVYARDLLCLAADVTAVAEMEQAASTELPADAEPVPNAGRVTGKLPRMVEWRKAIVINWPGIVELYGNGASALHVIAYLKKHDTSGCVLPGGGDRELKWRPTKGPDKSVPEKTVLNAMRELESKRLITRAIPA